MANGPRDWGTIVSKRVSQWVVTIVSFHWFSHVMLLGIQRALVFLPARVIYRNPHEKMKCCAFAKSLAAWAEWPATSFIPKQFQLLPIVQQINHLCKVYIIRPVLLHNSGAGALYLWPHFRHIPLNAATLSGFHDIEFPYLMLQRA